MPSSQTEIYQIFSEFTGDPNSFRKGHRLKGDIPEWLKSAFTNLDFAGNEEIKNKVKFASLINDQSSVLRKMAAQYLKKVKYPITNNISLKKLINKFLLH